MLERNAKHDFHEKVEHLMRKADIGDWFIIFLLSKNLDSIMFREFIDQLSEKLKTEPLEWDDLIWDTDPSQVLLQVRKLNTKYVEESPLVPYSLSILGSQYWNKTLVRIPLLNTMKYQCYLARFI